MTVQRHKGGSCPVHPDSIVRVWIRAADRQKPYNYPPVAAKLWKNWRHNGGPGDIVFFEQVGELAA